MPTERSRREARYAYDDARRAASEARQAAAAVSAHKAFMARVEAEDLTGPEYVAAREAMKDSWN